MDIAAWLDGLGLGQNEQAFRDDEIDVEISGRDPREGTRFSTNYSRNESMGGMRKLAGI